MALVWRVETPEGTKDGSNKIFTIQTLPDAATVRVVHNGHFLYGVTGDPGQNDYARVSNVITLGLAPNPDDDLWVMYSTTGVVLTSSSVPFQARKDFYWTIELRDNSNALVRVLQKHVNDVWWEYNTLGGCGECGISLVDEFEKHSQIGKGWDVQIWRGLDPLGILGARMPAVLPFALGSSLTGARELRYSGFIREIEPVFDKKESIRLHCSGYSRQLEYLSVYNVTNYRPRTYTNMDTGAIARALIDTYALSGSRCLRTGALALMKNTGVTVESVTFGGSVFEALKDLADLGGNAEFGVRADREVYFVPRQQVVKQTVPLQKNVAFYSPRTSMEDVVDCVIVRGANDTNYKLQNGTPAPNFFNQRTIDAPHIATTNDAILYAVSYLARFGSEQPKGQLRLVATDDWIENIGHPLGLVRVLGWPQFVAGGGQLNESVTTLGPFDPGVFDPDIFDTEDQTTPSGAQLPFELGKVRGATHDQSYRPISIRYAPRGNGLAIDIEMGERSSGIADQFRHIEYQLSKRRLAG
jgi:hypothetical protein